LSLHNPDKLRSTLETRLAIPEAAWNLPFSIVSQVRARLDRRSSSSIYVTVYPRLRWQTRVQPPCRFQELLSREPALEKGEVESI
jgi:hypothetical protein